MAAGMKYTENSDTITLKMSRNDYDQLILILGYATGMASRTGDKWTFYAWIDFVNRLNTGNPHFLPYEIPEEFKAHAHRP